MAERFLSATTTIWAIRPANCRSTAEHLLTTVGITSDRDVTLETNGGTIETDTFDSTLSGVIGGVGGLTKNGLGTLTLSGVNTYDGATTVNDGILELQNGAALNNANAVTVNTPGVLEVDDAETIGSLAGAGNVTLNNTLTTGDASPTEFSGNITGNGGLIKQGTGTFTLSGTNDYDGDTTVNGGILELQNGAALDDAKRRDRQWDWRCLKSTMPKSSAHLKVLVG